MDLNRNSEKYEGQFFLYSVGILAIVGVFVCFIGYVTKVLPIPTLPKQTSAITTPAAKKNYKCCAERVKRVKKANIDLLERNPIVKKVLTATEHETQ